MFIFVSILQLSNSFLKYMYIMILLLYLDRVSQAILYHLAELRGMSLWYEKFGVLGLTTQTLHTAIMTVGSFVLKSSELQQ